MKMPPDPEWYAEKAKLEDGCDVSAGLPPYIPGFVPSDADRFYNGIVVKMQIEMQRKDATIKKLCDALQWMVDNDETNEGDRPLEQYNGQTWNEINAYWIDGLNRARAALAEARGEEG